MARGLAGKLDAEVGLGRFEILGRRRFLLGELRVRAMAGEPRLEEFSAREVLVEGAVGEILEGRFELLQIRGLDVKLCESGRPSAGDGSAEFSARRVTIQGGKLLLPFPRPGAIAFAAELSGVPDRLAGEIVFEADQLDLGRLARMAAAAAGQALPGIQGELQGLHGKAARSNPSSGWRLSLGAGRLDAALEGRPAFPVVSGLKIEAMKMPGGFRVKGEGSLEGGGTFVAEGDLDDRGLPLALKATLADIALAPWAGWWQERFPGVEAGGSVGLEVDHSAGAAWKFRLHGAAEGAWAQKGEIRGGAFEVRGAFNPAEEGWTLAAEGSLQAQQGRWPEAPLPAEDLFPLRLHFQGNLRGGEIPIATGTIAIDTARDGRLTLSGEVRGTAAAGLTGAWAWEGETVERLAAWVAPFTGPLPGFGGKIRADGSLAGTWPDLTVQAGVSWEEVRAGGGPDDSWSLRDGAGKASLSWAGALRLDSFEAAAMGAPRGLEPLPVTLRGGGFWDPAKGLVLVERVEIGLPEAGPLRGALEWKDGVLSGKLELAGLSLPGWRGRLLPLAGTAWGAGLLAGRAGGAVEGSWSPGRGWEVRGKASLSGLGWSTEDGASAVQGPEVALDFTARQTPKGLVGGVEAGWKNFQVLRGGFFADYSAAAGTLAATVELAEGRLAGRFSLAVPGAFESRGRFAAGEEGKRFEVRLEVPDLGSAFGTLVQGPLGDAVPVLGKMKVEGALEAQGRWEESGKKGVAAGRVRLAGGKVSGAADTFGVEALEIDLPFAVSTPIVPGEDDRELEGRLGFQSLRAAGLEIPGLSAPLALKGDSLALRAPVTVPLFGGGVVLDGLKLAGVLSPSPSLEFDLTLSGIRLEEISRDLGLLPLAGELNAAFDRIRLSAEGLSVDGGSKVRVFGGEIAIHGISGEEILTRFPRLKFEVDFSGLDLQQITQTFDFGEMTGLVSGWARPVELFGWVPVNFQAQVATLERAKVRRTINVKAINNVAILGTGSRVTLLDRGLQRLFKYYTYDRLGLSLSLRQDVFLLRGLERRGPRELFLRGRLPFPIDVVNADPGKTVSFRAMLDRFSALEVKSVRLGRER